MKDRWEEYDFVLPRKINIPWKTVVLKSSYDIFVYGPCSTSPTKQCCADCSKAEGGFCDEVRLTRFVRFSLFFLSTFMCLPRPCNIRILYLFGNLADCERLFDKKIWLWFVLEFYHWVISCDPEYTWSCIILNFELT